MKRSISKSLPAILSCLFLSTLCVPLQAVEGPLVGEWTENAPTNAAMPPMPTPRFNVASAVVAGHLVVIGGQTAPGNENIVGTVEVYRSTLAAGPAAKNVWLTDNTSGGLHVPMPAPRAGASAAVVPDYFDNNKKFIVVIGGIGPDTFDEDEDSDTTEIISSSAVQIYDFALRTWDTTRANKPLGGWGATLVRVPEPFTDSNSDGDWNPGEPFSDTNGNGTWDAELHVLNGVCTVDPTGCTFPGNNQYDIYRPGRRDNPGTGGNEFLPEEWASPQIGAPPPEREASGALTASIAPQDNSPRYLYKFGGGTGGVLATQDARRLPLTLLADWEEVKTMPAPRVTAVSTTLQGVSAGGFNLQYPAVIGGFNGSGFVDTIYIYQPDLNGWVTDSTMQVDGVSRPRGGRFALGVIGNDIYIAGGQNNSGVDGSIIRATMNKLNTPPAPPVEDPLVGVWENTERDIPSSRTRFAYAQLGSKLYIFGGEDGSKASIWRDSLSDAVEAFDMATHTWAGSGSPNAPVTETPMPVNFSRGVAAVLKNASNQDLIYVVGGIIDPLKRDSIPVAEVDALPKSGNVYIYNPVTKVWTTGAPMPTPRSFMGWFVYQNKLHIVGGVGDSNSVVNTHEVYDPVTNSWTTDNRGAPFGGRQGGATTVADHGVAGVWAYWLGGSTNTTQTAQCARLNLSNPLATWEQIANVPLGGVSNGRAITIADNSEQYPTFFGGDFGPVACALEKVFHYVHPAFPDVNRQNTWTADIPMVIPPGAKVVRSAFAVGSWNSFVYVAGGDASACDLINRTLRAPILTSVVAAVDKIGDAKAQDDGVNIVVTTGKLVTLVPQVETGIFYMQDLDRTAGIKVQTPELVPQRNDLVTVSGRIGTDANGERIILNADITVVGSAAPAEPLIMRNGSIGGVPYTTTSGQASAYGLNNQGLLVKTTGKVTAIDFVNDYFVIDDGAAVESGQPEKGVKVIRTNNLPFINGSYVTVIGVVASEIIDGKLIRVIRGREDPSEVVTESF